MIDSTGKTVSFSPRFVGEEEEVEVEKRERGGSWDLSRRVKVNNPSLSPSLSASKSSSPSFPSLSSSSSLSSLHSVPNSAPLSSQSLRGDPRKGRGRRGNQKTNNHVRDCFSGDEGKGEEEWEGGKGRALSPLRLFGRGGEGGSGVGGGNGGGGGGGGEGRGKKCWGIE